MTVGRLTVLERAEDYITPSGQCVPRWLCECSCEQHNKVIVRHNNLQRGKTQSCGCLRKENGYKANKKYNTYDLSGEFGIGWSSNTNEEFYFDLSDYDLIKDYCWHVIVDRTGYKSLKSRVPITGKKIKMTSLLGLQYYDHIDRNPLNNRRENLRAANSNQNGQNRSLFSSNTSGFTGVYFYNNKWRTQIVVNKRKMSLGVYTNKEDAIKARLQAEAEYFGEFAPQKHLFEEYGITIQND